MCRSPVGKHIVDRNFTRAFLCADEIKNSRRQQLSVMYMLVAWLCTSVYSFINFLDPKQQTLNTDTTWCDVPRFAKQRFFIMLEGLLMSMSALSCPDRYLLSNTFQLAIGLSLVLVCGKWTNELQSTAFPYMLRVKQTVRKTPRVVLSARSVN